MTNKTNKLWKGLIGGPKPPECSTNELWKDLINGTHDKTTEALKDQDATQDSAEKPDKKGEDNEKKVLKTTVNKTAPQPESTEGMDYMLDYADENYGARIEAMIMVYMALKDDVNQGEEEDEKESLLDYLGLDKTNLTKTLMAAFGIFHNKNNGKFHADQDFEIWGLVGEAKDLQTLLYKQIFGLPENAKKPAIREMVDDLAKQLTLPELLSFNAQKRKKIIDTINEIMEKEEKEGGKLTIHEKIGIAKGNGITKPFPKKIFDEEKLKKMIAEIHGDGREMDPEPSQSNASHDTKKPSQTVGTQALVSTKTAEPDPAPPEAAEPAKPTEAGEGTKPRPATGETPDIVSAKEEENTTIDFAAFYEDSSAEVIEATTRLNALFKRLKDPNTDNSQLAADINKTSVAKDNLLGSKLYSIKHQPVQNMLKLLTQHFKEITSNTELAAKVIAIDEAFLNEGIY